MSKFRVEGFTGNPGKGVPLKHAITWFASDRTAAGTVVSLCLKRAAGGTEAMANSQALESWEGLLVAGLVWKLRDGDLRAKAFPPGTVAPVAIAPEWWHSVEVDLSAGTAEAHGLRLSGVLVFGKAEQQAQRNAAPRARPKPDMLAVQAALGDYIEKNPRAKQAEVIEALGKSPLNARKLQVEDAWSAIGRGAGRPPKARNSINSTD